MPPIFIITRDRVSCLKTLLERLGDHEDITLVDNDSTYGPMLEFLEVTARPVVRLGENLGHLAPWVRGLVPTDTPYVVTDPDVVPASECPEDYLEYMSELLAAHRDVLKVGFSLRVRDIPDHYQFKRHVQLWESQFWGRPIAASRSDIYKVPLDTTFALYRPGITPATYPAIRTGTPYEALHLPWYTDSWNPTEEDVYYSDHASRSVSSWLHDSISESLSSALKGLS